jgi:hypothetical protein
LGAVHFTLKIGAVALFRCGGGFCGLVAHALNLQHVPGFPNPNAASMTARIGPVQGLDAPGFC